MDIKEMCAMTGTDTYILCEGGSELAGLECTCWYTVSSQWATLWELVAVEGVA